MTSQNLKARIETLTGLKIQDSNLQRGSSLVWFLMSPTGMKLAELTVADYGNGFEFGGCSTAFPDDWQTLCRLHKR